MSSRREVGAGEVGGRRTDGVQRRSGQVRLSHLSRCSGGWRLQQVHEDRRYVGRGVDAEVGQDTLSIDQIVRPFDIRIEGLASFDFQIFILLHKATNFLGERLNYLYRFRF